MLCNVDVEAMRTILGCTRDTFAEAMRHILDLPCMDESHKLAQAKAYLRVALIPRTLCMINSVGTLIHGSSVVLND